MTTKPKTENQVTEELKKPEKKFDTSAYSCQIILEKTTIRPWLICLSSVRQ